MSNYREIFSVSALIRDVVGTKEVTDGYDPESLLKGSGLELEGANDGDLLADKINVRNQKIRKVIAASSTRHCCPDKKRRELRLECIDWRWILCYGARNHFDFRKLNENVTSLVAPNGHGKSAFLEVLCLALFGSESPGRQSKNTVELINVRKRDEDLACTELVFNLSGYDWRVRREFCMKSGSTGVNKLNQTVMLVDHRSGSVEATGKTAVEKWLATNLGTVDEFLMTCVVTQSSDRDFLFLPPKDQKAFVDHALDAEAVTSAIESVAESKRAHKWFADALETTAAAITNSSVATDPDDEHLAEKLYEVKRFSIRISKTWGQLVFLRLAKRVTSKRKRKVVLKNDIAERYGDLINLDEYIDYNTDIIDRVDCLEKQWRECVGRTNEARAVLDALSRVSTQGKDDTKDDSNKLKEKVHKYANALALAEEMVRARIDLERKRKTGARALQQPFNEHCWACDERCGNDRSAAKQEIIEAETSLDEVTSGLRALNVGNDPDMIRRKHRDYEKRLLAATMEDEQLGKCLVAAKAVDAAKSKELQVARKLAWLLKDVVYDAGNGGEHQEIETALATKHRKLVDLHRVAIKAASEMRALRCSANRGRTKARATLENVKTVKDKHEALRRIEVLSLDFVERSYRNAVSKAIVDRVNSMLGCFHGLELVMTSEDGGLEFGARCGGFVVPLMKTSGFQRAALGLAARVAVAELGVSGLRSSQLFLDEAFGGFDETNSMLIPQFVEGVNGNGYDAIMLVTHHSVDGIGQVVSIKRNGNDSVLLNPP